MTHCIPDTSVAIKWFFRDEELTEQADSVLQSGMELVVPDYFYLEMNSVLTKLTRKGTLSPAQVRQMSRALRALPVHVLETAKYRDLALDLSMEKNTGYFDCLYVVPAQITRIPLITADLRLYRTFANSEYGEFVQWLGDYQ
ncbi:MAG: type II toxin-antitoxin system VapC family toxin [Cyclonatronaceae bacterium]